MSSADVFAGEPSLHAVVTSVIRENMSSGHIAPGMTLRESALAEQFAVSRVPIARALKELESEGLVARERGKGYRVAGTARNSFEQAPSMVISDAILELVRGVPSWERIYDQVEHDLVAAMPFGRHKIVELAMADHYKVSRTVTSDLLTRLQERGLVQRLGRSQAILPALTEQLMTDLYQVRMLLEPAALVIAAPHVSRVALTSMHEALVEAEARYPDLDLEQLDLFEQALHVRVLDHAPNKRLLSALRSSQLPLLATNYLLKKYLGAPSHEPFLAEHRIVVELLMHQAYDAAAGALKAHLASACKKGVERISAVRSNHEPVRLPFLIAL